MWSVTSITPAVLVAGSTGNKAKVTITNSSVYTGTSTPAPYTFKIRLQLIANGVYLLNINQNIAMTAGQTTTVEWLFDVPGAASGDWTATARLATTDGSTQVGSQASVSGSITPGELTKPSWWLDSYPAFPPSWWGSSYNGEYVLVYDVVGSQGTTWIFPESLDAYLQPNGDWAIVP